MNPKEYIGKINNIREKKMISRVELAREMNLSYNTFTRFMDEASNSVCALKTLKKVKEFVEKHEGSL